MPSTPYSERGPGPMMYVVVFGSMAVGLSATPLLARALLVPNNPAAARLSALWLAGGAVMGGILPASFHEE